MENDEAMILRDSSTLQHIFPRSAERAPRLFLFYLGQYQSDKAMNIPKRILFPRKYKLINKNN